MDMMQKPPIYIEQSVDLQYLQKMDKLEQNVFKIMNELEGWCTKYKAHILMRLITLTHAKTIVEIGVFGGRSLIPMALVAKEQGYGHVFGIDPWNPKETTEGMDDENKKYWLGIDHTKILAGLQTKIAQYDLHKWVTLIENTSDNAEPIYDIDLLHIDGNHSKKQTFNDVKKWVPLVRKGGLIVFNDSDWNSAADAVAWLNANCIRMTEHSGENKWGIWIK